MTLPWMRSPQLQQQVQHGHAGGGGVRRRCSLTEAQPRAAGGEAQPRAEGGERRSAICTPTCSGAPAEIRNTFHVLTARDEITTCDEDGNAVVTYLADGVCNEANGACDHEEADRVDCGDALCTYGVCIDVSDPCAGITCETPPTDFCTELVAT